MLAHGRVRLRLGADDLQRQLAVHRVGLWRAGRRRVQRGVEEEVREEEERARLERAAARLEQHALVQEPTARLDQRLVQANHTLLQGDDARDVGLLPARPRDQAAL